MKIERFKVSQVSSKGIEKSLYIFTDFRIRFGDANLEAIIQSWSVRYRELSRESIYDYIHSKHPEVVCLTKKQFKRYINKLDQPD